MQRLYSFGPLLIVLSGLLTPVTAHSEDLGLISVSMRSHVSDTTILGKDAPEAFKEHALAATFRLPWNRYSASGWGIGMRLMTSAGVLKGAGESAVVVSLIPKLTLGSDDDQVALDIGAGGALLSRHHFGSQDYGGPFQFALTVGLSVPLYKKLGLGYRYMHYSDAAVYGPDTTGADLHLMEFSFRL